MADSDDELVEAGAAAIYAARNELDGDSIGTIINDNFRVEVRNDDLGRGDTMTVCRAAARAVLAAVRPKIEARERERAAKVASRMYKSPYAESVCINIAAAIRSKQETE